MRAASQKPAQYRKCNRRLIGQPLSMAAANWTTELLNPTNAYLLSWNWRFRFYKNTSKLYESLICLKGRWPMNGRRPEHCLKQADGSRGSD
jgi:hypothetical protein